ncbi:MAG: universal stress protein [Bacteroidetes bacterium]|jgi:nucleotide-binding universal stress UspA family protein|nr:universal stress protein [Bacteroidota bacterium]
MYKNILYPTDGSEAATAVLAHCRSLAETYDATIHVLYVAEHQPFGLAQDLPKESSGGMVGQPAGERSGMRGVRETSEEVVTRIEAHGRSIVDYMAEQLSNLSVQTSVKKGNPYEAILDYAQTHAIDLIVMGTHGRSGLDRYLLGSVTEKVIRMSDVPVLTVRQKPA